MNLTIKEYQEIKNKEIEALKEEIEELVQEARHYGVVNATSIVKDIVTLTDRIETVEGSDKAWRSIQGALSYLSSKDTMLKFKRERKREGEKE